MTRLELVRRFADNLEIERDKMGLSQKQMAQRLEMSLSSYKRIITYDVDKIDLYTAYKLYLLTGKFAEELIGINDSLFTIRNSLDELSFSQISFIEELIEFEKSFSKQHEDVQNYITVYIPTGNMEDGMIYDSSNVEKVYIAPYKTKYGDRINCGIRITSNHLHPVYNKGDILLISKSPIRDGDTGVFINRQNGCAYIRKYYQTSPCRLEPINDFGEIFYVDSDDKSEMDNWIKFGTVLTKMR